MFVIEVPFINLNQIYNSRQALRWIKLKDNKYVIPFGNCALKVEQQKERLIMSCSEDEFCNIWFDYFDLKTDYMSLNSKAKRLGVKFKVIANRGYGIHILNQNPFEMYIQTKLIANIGYTNALVVMNHISNICGVKHIQSMREAGRITWYEFPTPRMIIDNSNKLNKMGKINDWLIRLCEAIINDEFDYSNSGNELFKLFALHDMSVFPTNEIEDTLAKNFDCDASEFADWYLDEIKNKGLIYMYILHHKLNPPKRTMKYGID